jgi:hypothetical protein
MAGRLDSRGVLGSSFFAPVPDQSPDNRRQSHRAGQPFDQRGRLTPSASCAAVWSSTRRKPTPDEEAGDAWVQPAGAARGPRFVSVGHRDDSAALALTRRPAAGSGRRVVRVASFAVPGQSSDSRGSSIELDCHFDQRAGFTDIASQ